MSSLRRRRFLAVPLLTVALLLARPHAIGAQSQLLLQDFGSLHNLGEEPGESLLTGASRVAGADDEMRSTTYVDAANQILVVANVQTVTEPAWLLHELEGAFRSPDASGLEATIVESGARRRFDSSLNLRNATARIVAWPTGTNTIVALRFELKGANRGNDVPTQIVDAYLALHPSSLPASIDDGQPHQSTWVRDEMRRLLEYVQRDLGLAMVPEEAPAADFWRSDASRLLTRFAEYRERFYHVGSADAFTRSADAAERQNRKPDFKVDPVKQQAWLQARLEEFQNWWAAHQNDPVQFPTATPTPVPPATPTP